MRTGAAAQTTGIFHEAAVYASDTELRDTALPFLSDGVAAGEPTFVILTPEHNDLIRRDLGDPAGLTYVPAPDAYLNPALTVREYRRLSAEAVAAGAAQVRFITEVPHPGVGAAWDWWGRYESAANDIFADLPVWAVCSYDRRTTPADVVDEVLRSHPHLAGPSGTHLENDRYESPLDFMSNRLCTYEDPLEIGPATVDLHNPTISQARRVAAELAEPVLGQLAAEDLALAVSEVTANALSYGKPPVRLRLWVGLDRIVVTVLDHGGGLNHPTVGLSPVGPEKQSGRGLWIATQVCDHLSLSRSEHGFLIRLVKGTPSLGG